jgi:hypothetical protein
VSVGGGKEFHNHVFVAMIKHALTFSDPLAYAARENSKLIEMGAIFKHTFPCTAEKAKIIVLKFIN